MHAATLDRLPEDRDDKHMLGELVEFSLAADDPVGVAGDLLRLGFSTLDTVQEPESAYLPVAMTGISLGLNRSASRDPELVFVRPGLQDYLYLLKRKAVPLDTIHLEEDEFHWIGFTDPNGLRVRLLEARQTFPLQQDNPPVSPLGTFREFAMPCPELETARDFWTNLGLDTDYEEAGVCIRMSGCGLSLGLYADRRLHPGLCFGGDNLAARVAFLRALQVPVNDHPANAAAATATIPTAANVPLYLVAAGSPVE